MTFSKIAEKRKSPLSALTPGETLFGLFALFCLLLILRNSELAIEYMTRGLRLCAVTVIPSLFPFMVLSELIVSSGVGERLLRPLLPLLRRLFGLPNAGCCALVLGLVCGFPVGARCAVRAYERGALTKQETERVLLASGTPSSAFLITAVGESLWGNRRFGLVLYGVILFSAVLIGILSKRLQKKSPSKEPIATFASASAPTVKGAKLFTEAIASSAFSMLLICAYVIFFSTLVGTLGIVLSLFSLPNEWIATLFCIFELSGGVSQASTLGNTQLAALLSAFAAGWSGLSVHCQAISLCNGKGLSFRAYFLAKLAQGALAALFFGILLLLFPSLTQPAVGCF